MKVLHLTLKKKWFDMISSGEKKEEYRGYSHYWVRRLFKDEVMPVFKDFDSVHFVNGGNFHPSHPSITVQCLGIEIREGRPEWGAVEGVKYFVIKLVSRIEAVK